MRLIGMMDSPYVRRVAVSARLMGLALDHDQISVFRQFETFAAINPVVKAPTLVTDDGTVLMDSTLILDHLEHHPDCRRRLMPADPADRLRTLRLVGLALAACEKAVQAVYEKNLRPAEKQHEPWLTRVLGQLGAAWRVLEDEIAPVPWLTGAVPMAADVAVAVAWRFTGFMLPGVVADSGHPRVAAFSQQAETLDAFRACPLE